MQQYATTTNDSPTALPLPVPFYTAYSIASIDAKSNERVPAFLPMAKYDRFF
jgi:hypothetical protein